MPLRAPYRPVAVALGILARYAMLVVLVSSWARRRLHPTWWRRAHLLSVPTFALAMVHGIAAGSDTARPWMWWVHVGKAGVAVGLLGLRGVSPAHRRAGVAVSSRG